MEINLSNLILEAPIAGVAIFALWLNYKVMIALIALAGGYRAAAAEAAAARAGAEEMTR